MRAAHLCQIEWYLTGMTPGASSWNFCSILRRWPPLDILMRLWNTAAYGSPCRDLHRTCTFQLPRSQERYVNANVTVSSQVWVSAPDQACTGFFCPRWETYSTPCLQAALDCPLQSVHCMGSWHCQI